jgi:hypothetical protein
MRQRMVGDFLASLAVIERGGSSVRSASFPIEVEDQTEPETVPEPEPMPLYTANGDPVPFPRPPKAPPKKRKPDPNAMREVLLHLDGKQHDLAIGYLSETPVWRPSYRVVVAPDGKADLQAWGIVQNLSGEDWHEVALSLVAGAPLAFQSTLGTPVVPQRPVVTDQGEVVAVVPTGVTSLDQSAPPEPAPAPEAPVAAQADLDESAPAEAEAREEAKADRQMSIGAAGSGRMMAKRASRAAPGDPMAGNAASPPPSRAQAPMPAKPALSVSAPRR